MPILARPISEQTEHIFMPVAQQLSHRILHMLGYEDVIGDNIYLSSEWSSHSKTSNIEDNARIAENRFKADIELQLNPTSQKWEAYTFKHTASYGICLQTLQDPEDGFVLHLLRPLRYVSAGDQRLCRSLYHEFQG